MKKLSVFCLKLFFWSKLLYKQQHRVSAAWLALLTISKELVSLFDLMRAQIVFIHKLTKVIIIRKDQNHIFLALWIVLSNLKSFNNAYELFFVSILLGFRKNHFCGKISYQMTLAKIGHR